jgi:hypothetical protein
VRGDHLRIGEDQDHEDRCDHNRQRQGPTQRAASRQDEDSDHRLRPVCDARKRVEAQCREAAKHTELVAGIGMLARPASRARCSAIVARYSTIRTATAS